MRGLRLRIVIVGLLCGALGLFMSRSLARSNSEALIGRFAGRTILAMFNNGEGAKCEASPATWSLNAPGFSEVYAYAADSGMSANPAAAPLERSLATKADAMPDPKIAVALRTGARGGQLVLRVAPTGSCAYVQASWKPVVTPLESLKATFFGGGSVALASILLSLLFVIRPAAKRVALLRSAALNVGNARAYRSANLLTDDDFGQLSRELDRAHARIREEETRLAEHLANVAHDLRTPMASLHLALEQAFRSTENTNLKEPLVSALADVVYVRGLTENLRLATRFDDPQAFSEPPITFDLGASVERTLGRVRFFAQMKGLSLDLAIPDKPIEVRGDPIAVEQAVGNVIDNAVTHGTTDGHVAVVLRREGADRFVLIVVDDGPGVDEEDLPMLGKRTFRSDDARQRDPRGSGIGLAIASEVARRSGWELRFEREEPKGLRVTFSGSIATT